MLTGAPLVQNDLRAAVQRPMRTLLEPVHRAHPARAAFEHFIAARFRRAYGAQVTHFLPHLLGVRDGLARWQAAAGYAAAGAQTLFIEQYFDRPIESALATALARPIVTTASNLARSAQGRSRKRSRRKARSRAFISSGISVWLAPAATSRVRR